MKSKGVRFHRSVPLVSRSNWWVVDLSLIEDQGIILNLLLAFLTDMRQLSRSEASCCHD